MFTCSDMDLMRTAGMDSLMLNWQNTLGIQIFFPLTVVGLAVCESHDFSSTSGALFEIFCSGDNAAGLCFFVRVYPCCCTA